MLTLVTSVGSVLNNSGRMLRITGCGTCSRRWWCRGSWGWWWCESCTATTFLWSSHLAAGPRNISWTGELKNNLFSTSGLVGRLAWTGHLDTGWVLLDTEDWRVDTGPRYMGQALTWWDTLRVIAEMLDSDTLVTWSPDIRHGGAYNEGVDRNYHTPTSSAEFMILGILECFLLVSSTFLL